MKRYQHAKTIIKQDNKRIQRQTLYPPIIPKTSDLYIRVQDGQRLDTLANTYYGDPGMWWIIAQANSITGGTLFVPPGKQIRIPQDISAISRDLEDINLER